MGGGKNENAATKLFQIPMSLEMFFVPQFCFFGSLLNGTMFLKLMLGKVGESELIFVGIGRHWELCLWFCSKSLFILSPLSAWVANDVSGR